MKSLVRQSAAFAFISSTIVGSSVIGSLPARALSPDQIVQKLKPVPVFTILDNAGAPLIITVPNGNKKQAVTGVFISEKDAEGFVARLKTQNPNLAKTAKVIPVSLAEVYQVEQANENKPNTPIFIYVPRQEDVNSALAVLQQNGQKVNRFNGTPLFVAKAGKNKGYLSVKRDNQEQIPFFFSKNELQNLLNRYKQEQPNLAKNVTIEVISLEGLLQTFKTQNSAGLGEAVLIPPRESVEDVHALPSTQNPSQPNQP